MAAFTTVLNQANEFTEARNFAGGVGLLSSTGVFTAPDARGPNKIILQTNHTGEWKDLGDAILQQDEGEKAIYIPACQIRWRRSGTDATQAIVGHVEPSTA